MSNCELRWHSPSVLSLEKKSNFFKPITICCVTFEAHSCPWKASHRKFSKPSLTTSRMNSSGSQSYGWSPNSTNIGWDTTSRHCRQIPNQLRRAGGGALEGEVPPHFHCMCPPVGESQVYGPSLSPADVLNDQEWGVAMAGRPECMKLPPSLRSYRTRARNGKTLGTARQP